MTHPLFAHGHTALITGAALGIGRATALKLAGLGMRIVAVDLPGDDLDALESALIAQRGDASDILCLAADLSQPDAVPHIHTTTMKRFGAPQLLMNNAASREGRGFDGTTQQWKALFDVNLWALVEATRLFAPDMIKNPARSAIVNVGSKQGITNPPGTPAYNMAKAAVKLFTEQLQHDLRNNPDNQGGSVTSHLLVPGWTTTGKNRHKAGAWLPEQVCDYMIAAIDNGSFYIVCPDNEVSTDMDNRRIIWGAEDITRNRPPLSRWHTDHTDIAAKTCS